MCWTCCLIRHQHVALARQRAQDTDLVGRPEGAREQPEAHQLLQPLAVEHVGLGPRDVLNVPGIDQIDAETAALQQFVEWNPIYTRGFHRHRVHPACPQPVGQRLQLLGKALELPDHAFVTLRRYCHKVARGTHVDARGVRVCQHESFLASSHSILHHQLRNAAPVWVRRCTHSLKRDVHCHGLTNIADVTQDQANHRADYAPLRLRPSPARRSTLPHQLNPGFFTTPARTQAGCSANQESQ